MAGQVHFLQGAPGGGATDRRLIKERLNRDLQHANPPGHPGQVTQQVIAGLHPLHGRPPFLAETRHIAAVVQELLPRSGGEQVDPVGPRHRTSLAGKPPTSPVIFRQRPPAHQRPATSAAPRRAWFPHVARQRAGRRAGLRHGATLRLSSAAHHRPSAGPTPSARRAEPARRACRQRTRGPAQRGPVPGSRSDRQRATGLLANAATVTGRNGPPGEPDGDQAARVTGPTRPGFAQVTGWPTPIQRLGPWGLPATPAGGRCPIRTHVRRPNRPPLLYFPAVPAVRFVRITPLTSGAKRARTADLLHAISRQHVHPRPSVQVTVLPRPRKSARVRTSCGTFLLYRCHPHRGHQSRPQMQP